MTPIEEMTPEQTALWTRHYGSTYAEMSGVGLVDQFDYGDDVIRVGDVIDVASFREWSITARVISAGSMVNPPLVHDSRRAIIVEVMSSASDAFTRGQTTSISLWHSIKDHIRLNALLNLAEV